MKYTVIFLSLIVILFSCKIQSSGQKTKQESLEKSEKEWTVYDGKTFKIKYPNTWILSDGNPIGAVLILVPAAQQSPDFKNNFNLMIQDLSLAGETINIDRYTEITLKQIEENIGKDGLSYLKKGKNNIGEFCDLTYAGNYKGTDVKWKQRYYIIDNKAYLMTYTALPEAFEAYLKEMDLIIESFQLK